MVQLWRYFWHNCALVLCLLDRRQRCSRLLWRLEILLQSRIWIAKSKIGWEPQLWTDPRPSSLSSVWISFWSKSQNLWNTFIDITDVHGVTGAFRRRKSTDETQLRSTSLETLENRSYYTKRSKLGCYKIRVTLKWIWFQHGRLWNFNCSCDNGDNEALFLWNERPLQIPGCQANGLCKISTVIARYNRFLNANCESLFCSST